MSLGISIKLPAEVAVTMKLLKHKGVSFSDITTFNGSVVLNMQVSKLANTVADIQKTIDDMNLNISVLDLMKKTPLELSISTIKAYGESISSFGQSMFPYIEGYLQNKKIINYDSETESIHIDTAGFNKQQTKIVNTHIEEVAKVTLEEVTKNKISFTEYIAILNILVFIIMTSFTILFNKDTTINNYITNDNQIINNYYSSETEELADAVVNKDTLIRTTNNNYMKIQKGTSVKVMFKDGREIYVILPDTFFNGYIKSKYIKFKPSIQNKTNHLYR